MKTIMLIASVLISFNLLAADIYEFKYEAPAAKPVPVKKASHTANTAQPAASATNKPTSSTSGSAPAEAARDDSVVQQAHECTIGAICNDL